MKKGIKLDDLIFSANHFFGLKLDGSTGKENNVAQYRLSIFYFYRSWPEKIFTGFLTLHFYLAGL